MTKYKQCGHESDGIIILDSNELSMAGWIEWSESVGVFGSKELCWTCYCRGDTAIQVNHFPAI